MLLGCSAVSMYATGQTIPEVHGRSFAGVAVDLPDALRGKVGILVIGFSQGSREAVELWGKRLATNYYDSPTVRYYEMPVLASVPKLLRGFVTSRIKAAVSDRGKPHFLPVDDHETEWRRLAHYTAQDSAYVLVVDGRGVVRWQTQGLPSETVYAALQQNVDALKAEAAKQVGQ